jgi:antitoxin component YwqK of YwqJK toxin-antitoxin module
MKAILFALFIGLLVAGCEESSTPVDPVDSPQAIDLDDPETLDRIIAEAIEGDKLKKGDKDRKLAYAPNEQTPYSGWAKHMHDNGKLLGLAQVKDGKQDGLMLIWHKNGQKRREANFKDGKRDGLSTEWDENGQKKYEETYKDDKLVTAVAWKPDGEKCPVTNVVDGNGVVVFYIEVEDGTELGRQTFKDGEPVED